MIFTIQPHTWLMDKGETMLTYSGALLELAKLLDCAYPHRLVRDTGGKWELWFCGDDFGKAPEKVEAEMAALTEFDRYYPSRNFGEVVASEQGEILGFDFGPDYTNRTVITQLAWLMNKEFLFSDSYTVGTDLVMRPNGSIIEVDVVVLEHDMYAQDDEEEKLIRRTVSRFDYYPDENKLTGRASASTRA